MMWFWQLLAQAAQTAEKLPKPVPPPTPEKEIPPDFLSYIPIAKIWETIQGFHWFEGAVMISFGIIFITYGWRIFKALVVINFAFLGIFAGRYIGTRLGSGEWGSILAAVALSAVSYPFIKYGVAVLGGLAGSVVGSALWRLLGLPEPLFWCGSLAGLIAGGFLVFASFKISVIMISSLEGSLFIVAGVMALLNSQPEIKINLTNAIYTHPALLPSLVIAPTLLGIFFQHKLHKADDKWVMPT